MAFPSLSAALKHPCIGTNQNYIYREMLFTTAGLNDYISGAILSDETIRQLTNDGTPLPEFLTKPGIIPGIKVDKGTIAFANFDNRKQPRPSRRAFGARELTSSNHENKSSSRKASGAWDAGRRAQAHYSLLR